MTTPFTCDDKARLVAYLYGEADPADRAAVEAHLRACPACAGELEGFRAVRRDLRAWEPPDADLGFRIVRDTERTRTWWRRLPVWAPASIAAVLVLAAAAALAQLEIRYGQDGLTMRTGWARTSGERAIAVPAPAAPAPAVAPAGVSEAEFSAALAALEQRLRRELAPAPAAPIRTQASAPAAESGAVLQRVRALIEESERRQQRELALRLTQLVQDFEAQRRLDLVRIEQGLGQLEGVTGEEAARQRRLLNYLVRASQQR